MLIRRRFVAAAATLILATFPRPLLAADGIRLRALGDGLVAAKAEIAGRRLEMMVDTGASRSLIRATVAARLHLTPRARYDLETPTGVVEAVCAGPIEVHLAGSTLPIDCLGWSRGLDDTALGAGVDGVLAADALVAMPAFIDPDRGRLILGPEALAVTGPEVPLSLVEGRPVVMLTPRRRTGEQRGLHLVVDSGANELILFGEAAGATGAAGDIRLATLSGDSWVATAPAPRLVGLRHAPSRALLLPAVTDRREDGLLPLTAAGPVAFDWGRGVAILGARPVAAGR